MRHAWVLTAAVIGLHCHSASSDGATPASGAPDASSGGDASVGATLAADPEIVSMLTSPSADRIASAEQTLAAFGTRSACSTTTDPTQGIVAARDWIEAQYQTIAGLNVTLYTFAQTGCTTPFMRDDVVAVLPGAHSDRLIVVGGHYDSRTVDVTDGTSPAPGANDSGSQTANVLEIARAMAGHAFDATVVFVAFAGEEQGLVGSAALAQNVGTLFPGATVEAVLNCDIVGGDNTANDAGTLGTFRLFSPGTPREILGPIGTTDDTSPSRGLMRYVATWGGLYVPALTIDPQLREDRPGRGGDHESFIAQGWPGVRFIDPAENLAHEHTADDLFQYVTPSYTQTIAQVMTSVAASLARAPSAPVTPSVSGDPTSLTISWSPPADGVVDHFVVAARPVSGNFYLGRVGVPSASTSASYAAADLGITDGSAFFVSVSAVDASGHESLFAYPETRCDATGCVVPPAALNVTASN